MQVVFAEAGRDNEHSTEIGVGPSLTLITAGCAAMDARTAGPCTLMLAPRKSRATLNSDSVMPMWVVSLAPGIHL
ncbi:MAG: hypothetical protein MPL62_11150, partial [Alphaproteobacteria bacterium]|nr:hypothetical protein [Alphaproteobacteria bacterium]